MVISYIPSTRIASLVLSKSETEAWHWLISEINYDMKPFGLQEIRYQRRACPQKTILWPCSLNNILQSDTAWVHISSTCA